MPGTNQFLPFAVGTGANVLTAAEYAALAALSQGFQSGIASSKNVNTPLRQATFVAAAIAQIIANTGVNVADDGNLTTFVTNLLTALAAATNPVMDGTVSQGTATRFARADHVHPTDTTRAPLASPAFTGTPTAPTQGSGDSSTNLATTAFVNPAVSFGSSGYQKFASGLILQWGQTTVPGTGGSSWVYPVAFPNAALTGMVCKRWVTQFDADFPVMAVFQTYAAFENYPGLADTYCYAWVIGF